MMNPYFYQPYPQMFQNQQAQPQQPVQPQQPPQDERIWVQGEIAAQSYLVAPNSFVRLWDSQAPVFYEKRADASGRPYMETYEYMRRGAQAPTEAIINQKQQVDYGDEIKALKARIEALERGGMAHDEQ